MGIKLLALDLDGTTLNSDHHTISEANLAAIRAAANLGIHIVIATGRVLKRLPPFVCDIPQIRYLITSNGAAVNDIQSNQLLFSNYLPMETVERVLDAIKEFPLYLEIYSGGSSYVDRSKEYLFETYAFTTGRRAMLTSTRIVVDDLRTMLRENKLSAEKINLPFLPPEMKPTVLHVLNSLSGITITSSVPQNAEINVEGCTKGAALAFLCKHLGCLPEEVLAIGDNGNDLEMLDFSGISVAPSNATEEAKALADFVGVSNDESVVAQAIETYILRT